MSHPSGTPPPILLLLLLLSLYPGLPPVEPVPYIKFLLLLLLLSSSTSGQWRGTSICQSRAVEGHIYMPEQGSGGAHLYAEEVEEEEEEQNP